MDRCVYVWMDGWIDVCMDGWMVGWMHGWMDGWMDGRTDRWMDGRTHAWMDERTKEEKIYFLVFRGSCMPDVQPSEGLGGSSWEVGRVVAPGGRWGAALSGSFCQRQNWVASCALCCSDIQIFVPSSLSQSHLSQGVAQAEDRQAS